MHFCAVWSAESLLCIFFTFRFKRSWSLSIAQFGGQLLSGKFSNSPEFPEFPIMVIFATITKCISTNHQSFSAVTFRVTVASVCKEPQSLNIIVFYRIVFSIVCHQSYILFTGRIFFWITRFVLPPQY